MTKPAADPKFLQNSIYLDPDSVDPDSVDPNSVDPDAIDRNQDSAATSRARGPFMLSEINLHRYWYSIRNVFFPMHNDLARYAIALVDTAGWEIVCDRSTRRIEIANRVFNDRNDLRATLVVAAVLAQPRPTGPSVSPHAWLNEIARVGSMAAFIKHRGLSRAIYATVDVLRQSPLGLDYDGDTNIARGRLTPSDNATIAVDDRQADRLFDDTFAANDFAKQLQEELNLKHRKRKARENAA